MADLELSQMLGNALGTGTAVAAVLLLLWRVLKAIADRFIAGFDAIAKAVTEHTKTDLAHHAKVRETILEHQAEVRAAIVRVEAKVDSALDWRERTPVTPIEVPVVTETPSERRRRQQRTNPQGYRLPRPGTRDDNE